MDPEQRAILIDAMESAMLQAGVSDMYAGAEKLLAFIDAKRPLVAASISRDALDAYFASCQPMDVEECTTMGALLCNFYPLFTGHLQRSMKKAVADMPVKRGRKVVVTPEFQRQVIEYVSRLYTTGVTIGIAQKRAAQHAGCGLRTVQRIWRERKKLAQQPFQSIEDVWKFFETQFANQS